MKNFSNLLIAVSLISTLSACSSVNSVPTSNNTAKAQNASASISQSISSDNKFQNLVKEATLGGQEVFVADAGNGKQSSASFAVKINFGRSANQFSTKASSSGVANKTLSDLQNLKVILVEDTVSPTGDLSSKIKAGPFTISKSVNASGDVQTVLFKNVQSTTAGSRYYVAVAALDAGSTNITNLNAAAYVGSTSNKFYVTSNSTFVGPAPSYTIASADQSNLTISLKLADAIGATLQSEITVNQGESVDPIAVSAQ